MADVFVSYARVDQDRVEPIVAALEAGGVSVWWDRQIDGGADFVQDTETELNRARVCLVCWSASSTRSKWVRDEASAGAELGKIVPVQFDADRPPLGFRQYQTIDLSPWKGDSGSPALARLVEVIRQKACEERNGRSAAPAGEPLGTIAVLPFVNLSGDDTCQNFCDAVGADIISLLARNKDLKVLARGSSFPHREPGVTTSEIGRKLGVRYVIDGTIRRSPTAARITIDLVLSATGQLLWSGQSEGRLDDVFALQDEMAQYLASVIAPELRHFERELAARKDPNGLTAWECAQRGAWHLFRLTPDAASAAESWFEQAISLDQDFSHGHAGLAHAKVQSAFLGGDPDRDAHVDAALSAAAMAVRLAPDDAYCRFVSARAFTMNREFDAALAESEAAIRLNPTYAHGFFSKGCALLGSRSGGREALAQFEKAIEMSAQDPLLTFMYLMQSIASLMADDPGAAEQAARRSVRQHNATPLSFAILASILGIRGAQKDAAPVVRRLLEARPGYDCETLAADLFFVGDEEVKQQFCDGLKKAYGVAY